MIARKSTLINVKGEHGFEGEDERVEDEHKDEYDDQHQQ